MEDVGNLRIEYEKSLVEIKVVTHPCLILSFFFVRKSADFAPRPDCNLHKALEDGVR